MPAYLAQTVAFRVIVTVCCCFTLHTGIGGDVKKNLDQLARDMHAYVESDGGGFQRKKTWLTTYHMW